MEHKSVYTNSIISTDENGEMKVTTVEIPRKTIVTEVLTNGKFKCQVHYEDGKGRSTGKQNIILKSNKNSEGYIVSENVKGETIGTLTKDSFLKGNDTRLILGMNASPKADLFIQKRLQSPKSMSSKKPFNRLKELFAKCLNSLNL
jgi:hypothetical protein